MSKYLRELFVSRLNIGVPIHFTRLSTLIYIIDISNLLAHKRHGSRDRLEPNRAFHAKRVCRSYKETSKTCIVVIGYCFFLMIYLVSFEMLSSVA